MKDFKPVTDFWKIFRAASAIGVLLVLLSNSASAQNRDFGEDVSHFDIPMGSTSISTLSWAQMAASGKKFVYVKSSEGLTGADDPATATNVARATAAGLIVGVYHVPHPENRPTTNGAIMEADHFLSYSGTAIGPGRLRPTLDIEQNSSALNAANLTAWVIAFSNEIIAQRGSNSAPIIYCNENFANNNLDSRLVNYSLWLAIPDTSANPTNGQPPAASGIPRALGVFANWSFWQYSFVGSSGGISPLDLDVCHSEYQPLLSYIIPGPPVVIASGGFVSGKFQLSFTNTIGRPFRVFSSTDASLPVSRWTMMGQVTENPAGHFQFTDTQNATGTQRFYAVRSP